MAADPQSLITAASAFQLIRAKIICLQIQIKLLQQIAGNTMTVDQLITAATSLQEIRSEIQADQIIIYLLNQITSGSDGSGTTGLYSGSYGGIAPTFTPPQPVAIAFDTVTGDTFNWYNNSWH